MRRLEVLLALTVSSAPMLAQEPTPAPAPAPAVPAQPPTAVTISPMARASAGPRRGWFGIQMTCDDCFITRGPGRVAYVQRPAISWVESGSPAYQAGLRSGDTIMMVDGLSITTPDGFERFANALPGTPVRFTVRHSGQERDVLVTPAENASASTISDFINSRVRIGQRQGLQALRNAFRSPIGWLGLSLECEQCSVTSFGRRQQSWTFREPPAVLAVDVDGPAHRALLRRGDTLLTIDGVDLTTQAGGRAFAEVEPGQRVTLSVRRDGRERRVVLTAVARPDASREEVAAFEEYKRTRDSSETAYKEAVTASVARAQVELRDLERALREADLSRSTADSSRRRLMTVDSLIRSLRNLERQRSEFGGAYGVSFPTVPSGVMAGTPPYPSMVYTPVVAPVASSRLGLRYSNRLGDVNVEVRSVGAPTISEVGDSLVIVQFNGIEVKVAKRVPAARR